MAQVTPEPNPFTFDILAISIIPEIEFSPEGVLLEKPVTKLSAEITIGFQGFNKRGPHLDGEFIQVHFEGRMVIKEQDYYLVHENRRGKERAVRLLQCMKDTYLHRLQIVKWEFQRVLIQYAREIATKTGAYEEYRPRTPQYENAYDLSL